MMRRNTDLNSTSDVGTNLQPKNEENLIFVKCYCLHPASSFDLSAVIQNNCYHSGGGALQWSNDFSSALAAVDSVS